MACSITRLLALVSLFGLLAACEGTGFGGAPADDPAAEPLGDQINQPTDGAANELTVE